MAVKDSGELAWGSRYSLGEYNFRIERSSVPGSTNDKIEAICTKDGKNARKSIQIPSSAKILGWYVEANETEASVYVVIDGEKGNLPHPISYIQGPYTTHKSRLRQTQHDNQPGYVRVFSASSNGTTFVTHWVASQEFNIPRVIVNDVTGRETHDIAGTGTPRTVNGKTVYVYSGQGGYLSDFDVLYPVAEGTPNDQDFYYVVYGKPDDEDKLVGRFAIDIKDAGGVGPGSDWTDPEDGGDPAYTLYVEVTGALSGRHNDPIVDPSYSYIPADKATVKDYGCGGDGGHGGGGGAGASTVVIHKFATNQANSKEVTAIARRHGYGSGGGKGGKGGDGCILVYY